MDLGDEFELENFIRPSDTQAEELTHSFSADQIKERQRILEAISPEQRALRDLALERLGDLQRKEIVETRKSAIIDELTGALNRRGWSMVAESFISFARRQGQPVSLLGIDVNFLGAVNNTFGHPEGDDVIKRTVDICKKNLRKPDVIARMGGDEFNILLPGIDEEQAGDVAKKIKSALDGENAKVDETGNPVYLIPVTFALGVTLIKPDEDLPSALRRVDALMYEDKQKIKAQK